MHKCILTELGIIIYEKDRFLKSFAFDEPARQYTEIKNKKGISGEVVRYLAGSDVLVNDESLRSVLKKESVDCQMADGDECERIQSAKPQILAEAGLAGDEKDAMERLRSFAMELSSSKITEISQSPDLHAIQAINTLDDLDKITNIMGSHLREWYSLHFPELDNLVDSLPGYAQLVLVGRRGDLSRQAYADAGFPDSKIEMLELVQEKSRGADISDENFEIVQTLAGQILDLHKLRKKMEDHMESQMKAVAPNLTAILGTTVSARMIAKAGSLRRLAMMPSSTIQIIGAERALFRSIKTGTQPPKHGLLFQHPLVHAAPRWQRGKIARAVASKAAIAARVDMHDKELNATLLEKLNIRIDEIDKKYKDPPPPRPDRPEKKPARGGFKKRFDRAPKKGKKRKRFGKR